MFSPDFVAVVTGGSSGIGLAAAHAFLRAGARVIATGLTQEECDASGLPDARAIDVTDRANVDALFAGVPRVDALVCCAGSAVGGGRDLNPDIFSRTLAVNLLGTLHVCNAARAKLAERKGAIVTIASMYALFGSPVTPGYAASKGGVVQLTKSLAVMLAKDGVRANAVAPGWIRTPMTRLVQADESRNANILARTPLGRWGEPEDVAGPILFLCSDAARFVTGVILPVDGGYAAA